MSCHSKLNSWTLSYNGVVVPLSPKSARYVLGLHRHLYLYQRYVLTTRLRSPLDDGSIRGQYHSRIPTTSRIDSSNETSSDCHRKHWTCWKVRKSIRDARSAKFRHFLLIVISLDTSDTISCYFWSLFLSCCFHYIIRSAETVVTNAYAITGSSTDWTRSLPVVVSLLVTTFSGCCTLLFWR